MTEKIKDVTADMQGDENEKETQKEKTLEEAFADLGALAEKLEDGETSLEDSFRLYKEGMNLLKYCSSRLDTVEKKMLQLDEEGNFSEFNI